MIIVLILVISILFVPIRFLLKSIRKYGYSPGIVTLMILLLFYILVPFLYLLLPQYRDDTTLFNILLSKKSDSEVVGEIFVLSILIGLYVLFYRKSKKAIISIAIPINSWKLINAKCYNRIKNIADVCFFLGSISVLVCMSAVGGFMSYLAFGVNMRGIDKDMTMAIDSSLLPLITLSTIVLVSPYLYYVLLLFNKQSRFLKVKFILSLILAIVYLLYNQGRLPLILFFIPFVLNLDYFKKKSFMGLLLLALGSVFLLSILDSLFIYFSFGYWGYSGDSSFLNKLLLEFTYPFSDFVNKDILLDRIGYRYGYDYIVWLLLLIPASVLSPFGIVKKEIATIGLLNTEAYGKVLNMNIGGGIPTDLFTFNYYQLGWFSLIISILFFSKFMSWLDGIVMNQRFNAFTHLIVLRVSFLMISLVNNFDFSVVFRMRFDLLILIYVLYYINRNTHVEDLNLKQ